MHNPGKFFNRKTEGQKPSVFLFYFVTLFFLNTGYYTVN